MSILFCRYRWWSVGIVLTVLCILGGILAARSPARAQGVVDPCYFTTGPLGLVRGQTSRHIFALPAVQRQQQDADCHLMVMDSAGNTFIDTTFRLSPGSPVTADLSVLADGRVRFNGKPLTLRVGLRDRLEVIPCVFIANMADGVPLMATAQCVTNLSSPSDPVEPGAGEPVRLGATTCVLRYVEEEPSGAAYGR